MKSDHKAHGFTKVEVVVLMEDRAENGFSLIELMVVVAIVMVVMGFAVVNVQSSLKDARVNSAYMTTLTTLRQAREAAVTQRRLYVVTFTVPRTMTIVPQNPAVDALNVTATLPDDVSFDAQPGLPNTATTVPDGMGSGSSTGAIDFNVRVGAGGSNVIYFWPDGSARDRFGNINDGVVYIARPGELLSSRAITLRGLTGRIRGWRLRLSAGVGKWSQI